MSEKPILFNTPMVQALLDDRKTNTRRIMKPQPKGIVIYRKEIDTFLDVEDGAVVRTLKPPYLPGDILYVRETWTCIRNIETGHLDYFYMANPKDFDTISSTYLCDDDGFDTGKPFPWKPSIHMPKEIARIFLRVTSVRPERLQDIGLGGCYAEGCPALWERMPKEWFVSLWDKLNAKRGYGWNTNCWVWVVEFERAEAPR